MRLNQALPAKKYAEAAKHSLSPEFQHKVKESIANLQKWMASPKINRDVPVMLNFSYGKDSMAVAILLKLAGIPFVARTLVNGADLAIHETIYPEFDRYFISTFGEQDFRLFYPTTSYLDDLQYCIDWGNINGLRTAQGLPLDFFDLGDMCEILEWKLGKEFEEDWYPNEKDFVYVFGNRAAEGQHKMFLLDKGHFIHKNADTDNSFWQAEPIAKWRDIDVWAFLIQHDCPVSPVYGCNKIPQRTGRNSYPTTLWYPCSVHWSSTFYRWMREYSPVQLAKLCEQFPEIVVKFQKK